MEGKSLEDFTAFRVWRTKGDDIRAIKNYFSPWCHFQLPLRRWKFRSKGRTWLYSFWLFLCDFCAWLIDLSSQWIVKSSNPLGINLPQWPTFGLFLWCSRQNGFSEIEPLRLELFKWCQLNFLKNFFSPLIYLCVEVRRSVLCLFFGEQFRVFGGKEINFCSINKRHQPCRVHMIHKLAFDDLMIYETV